MTDQAGGGLTGVPPSNKTCPSCGRTVVGDARLCPYCGQDFGAGQTAPDPGPPPPQPVAPVPPPPGATFTPPAVQYRAPQAVAAPPTNGYAIASLVCGIAGYVAIPLVGHILALVFGYVARGQIDRSGGNEGGRGMAVAGIILGWIGLVLSIIGLIIAIIVISVVATNGAHIIINGTPVTFTP